MSRAVRWIPWIPTSAAPTPPALGWVRVMLRNGEQLDKVSSGLSWAWIGTPDDWQVVAYQALSFVDQEIAARQGEQLQHQLVSGPSFAISGGGGGLNHAAVQGAAANKAQRAPDDDRDRLWAAVTELGKRLARTDMERVEELKRLRQDVDDQFAAARSQRAINADVRLRLQALERSMGKAPTSGEDSEGGAA